MVKISVIVPVYNVEKYLKRCLDSILNQSLDDIEVICIDDGSSDNSLKLLNKLKHYYNFLKVFHQDNQGASVARNNGLKKASGEFVGFLDADDIFLDEKCLEEMYNFAIDKNLVMVSSNFTFIDQEYNIEVNPHYKAGDYTYFDDYGIIHPKDYGIPYCFTKGIFNLEFLKSHNINFPHIKAGEDPVFLANVFANISQIGTVPLTLYGYNHTVGGGVNEKVKSYEKKFDYIKHFRDVCDILDKAGLHNTSDFYKIHLFRFLTWSDNNHDEEIFHIFNEVWGIENNTFDRNDFNYARFIIPAKFYFLLKFDCEEFFMRVTKDFIQINICATFAIDRRIIEEYFMVIYAYSFEEFKVNCAKYLNNNIKFKKEFFEFKIKKFIFNLSINNNQVSRQNLKLILLNNPLLNSDSFSKNTLKKCYEIITE